MSPGLCLALLILTFGIVAFGLVMLKVAYDLQHPLEFIAAFFAASLVILIGGALAVGFGLRFFASFTKKNKNTS